MWLHQSPTDVPWLLSSSLLLWRYRFSLCAVIAEMSSNLLNHTTTSIAPSLYSAWFRISKWKTSMHVSPRWSSLNYALPVPLDTTSGPCINSQWQWEEWLSSCMVKTEGKALSFIIHHPPAVAYTAEIMEWGFPSSALRYVCVSLSVLAGFYPVNHTDCLQSYLHHCFDGITGELAHAFFPPTGEIHFDDHEYWILGNMRFSWKKGMCLYQTANI